MINTIVRGLSKLIMGYQCVNNILLIYFMCLIFVGQRYP